MMKNYFCLSLFFCIALLGYAQDTAVAPKNIKTGWTFGLLPSVAYDSDLGFQYGGLVNFYNFGDGSTYPNYKHSIMLEMAKTTKGGGKNQIFYDSGQIFFKNRIRITADLSYLTEQAMNFYGFNGAGVRYNSHFEDETSSEYISRMFYRHERKIIRTYADFQGNVCKKKLRWLGGIAYYNYKIGNVDIARLNKGKDPDELLPDTISLYDKYISWGIIPQNEVNGGDLKLLKVGLIYDTRDIEANPSRGIWSEVIVQTAPRFVGNTENAFTKMVFTFRQYLPLYKKQLNFVYRIGYQFTVEGNVPFYYQPIMLASYSPCTIFEGLGGAKSIRGILRNRLVGEDFAYGNFEFRYKFVSFVAYKQNVYIALNPFFDVGRITNCMSLNGVEKTVVDPDGLYLSQKNETFHYAAGCGLHVALNENFVLSVNYGMALNKQDGEGGLYIGTNWLF